MKDRLRKKRESLGIVRAIDLDELAGFKAGTVSRLETGYMKFSRPILDSLAKAFGETFEELMQYLDPPQSKEMSFLCDELSGLSPDELLEIAVLVRKWKREKQ